MVRHELITKFLNYTVNVDRMVWFLYGTVLCTKYINIIKIHNQLFKLDFHTFYTMSRFIRAMSLSNQQLFKYNLQFFLSIQQYVEANENDRTYCSPSVRYLINGADKYILIKLIVQDTHNNNEPLISQLGFIILASGEKKY